MCKLTKNLPIHARGAGARGVGRIFRIQGEELDKVGEKYRVGGGGWGLESPVEAMLWNI